MDNKTKYDMVVKLSKFYISRVQPNLEGFNKARMISNTAITGFWIIWFSMLSVFGLFVFTAAGFIPPIVPAIVFVFSWLLGLGITLYLRMVLEPMDKHNIIHVYQYYGNETLLPYSADDEIKKYLMRPFIKIFKTLEWRKGEGTISTCLNNRKYINTLNILNVPFLTFDDFITGTYQGININIAEPDSSIFKPWIMGLGIYLILWGGAFCFKLSPMLTTYLILPVFLIFAIIFGIRYITSKHFRGLLVEIDMNKDFEGHTFILERNNIKDNKMVDTSAYEEVKLEDVDFGKKFRVWSQNQIEARYILTTAFMERIKAIKQVFKAKYVRAAFKDKKIILAIHTGHDMFQMAGLNSMTKETFIQLFNEICAVLDLIDILKLNEKLGL